MVWFSMQAVFFIMKIVFKVERNNKAPTSSALDVEEVDRQEEKHPETAPTKSIDNVMVPSMNQDLRQDSADMEDIELSITAKAA
jgi:hypothetical protein